MTRPRNAVVVMMHHGLGDVVMTLPMLYDIDRSLPQGWHLCLIVKGALEASLIDSIAWQHQVSTELVGAERSAAATVGHFRLAWRIRRMAPATFIAPHMLPNFTNAVFARISGAPVSAGAEHQRRSFGFQHGVCGQNDLHKAVYYAKFAEVAGLRDPTAPLIYPPLMTNPPQARAPAPTILFAPGSGASESHKRWPLQNFARLAALLSARVPGSKIILFGSAAEKPLLAQLRGLIGDDIGTEVVVPATIGESIAALARADCVVGGCSGSLHLAALADRPCVALYGPTNPSATAPYSDKLTVVRQEFACSPCYALDFTMGCGNPVCMGEISAELVLSAILEVLEGRFEPAPRNIRTQFLRKPTPFPAGAGTGRVGKTEVSP